MIEFTIAELETLLTAVKYSKHAVSDRGNDSAILERIESKLDAAKAAAREEAKS